MVEVKRVWKSEDHFNVGLSGDGWGIVLSFPVYQLATGASLARLMTLKVRDILKNDPIGIDQEAEFKEAASAAIPMLREIIEPYFAAQTAGVRT